MQFPPYIDGRLACVPDDLPYVLYSYEDQLVWRRIGTCMMSGRERDLCLAFTADTAMAVRLGLLSTDGQDVDPLPLNTRRKIQFVRRELSPRSGCTPGISLLFLQQVALHMEHMLYRNLLTLSEQGRVDKSAVMRMIPEIFGTSSLPAEVSPEDALFLIAAKLTVRAFYDAGLYGGRDNLVELIGAFDFLCRRLTDEHEELEAIAQDLRTLNDLHPSQIEAHAKLQRHVTAYIVALLRHVSWRQENIPLAMNA